VFSWFVFYTLYLFLQASGLTLMLWIIFKPKYCKSKVCVLCFPEWFDWGKHLSCPFLNKLIHLLSQWSVFCFLYCAQGLGKLQEYYLPFCSLLNNPNTLLFHSGKIILFHVHLFSMNICNMKLVHSRVKILTNTPKYKSK
jgi:hypothetical protein